MSVEDYVSGCLQLALLLEVSAYPKPGNVHRTADFRGTRYEHFLASSVALASSFRAAASRGVLASRKEIELKDVGVGRLILDSVQSAGRWQHGGNTCLGSVVLLCPIAVAAGMASKSGGISAGKLRVLVKRVVGSTTPEDAVLFYEAVKATEAGGLGEVKDLDIKDSRSKDWILRDGITLLEVFRKSSLYDSVALEWTSNYATTFDLGYPYFKDILKQSGDVNTATVQTFLKILSEKPDTLIRRKAGMDIAKEVSSKAKSILGRGGMLTQSGRRELEVFDAELRAQGNKLNPGTTADLTASTLGVAILEGFRP